MLLLTARCVGDIQECLKINFSPFTIYFMSIYVQSELKCYLIYARKWCGEKIDSCVLVVRS